MARRGFRTPKEKTYEMMTYTKNLMELQKYELNVKFIKRLEKLMKELQWQSSLDSTMLGKMKNALYQDADIDAITALEFARSIVYGEVELGKAFKALTMLVSWYLEESFKIDSKISETKIVIPDHRGQGKMHIATLRHSRVNSESSTDELSKAFDEIFKLDKRASSKTGGQSARYITSKNKLQSLGHSIETVEDNNLTRAYFLLAQVAKKTRQITATASDGKTLLRFASLAFIPYRDKDGLVKYYDISTMGDIKESYLALHLGGQSQGDMLSILQGALSVDNASGLAHGDISREVNGQLYETAVKGSASSAMGSLLVILHIYGLRALVTQLNKLRNKEINTQDTKSFQQSALERTGFLQYNTSTQKWEPVSLGIEIPYSIFEQKIQDEVFKQFPNMFGNPTG